MGQLAADAGVGGSHFTRILRLSFLAPEVKAILRDRHPNELTAKRLANEIRLPISSDEATRAPLRNRLTHRVDRTPPGAANAGQLTPRA